MLKDGWTSQSEQNDDIVSYENKVYDRLQLAKEIVEKNMEKTQKQQNQWYNKKAREMQLEGQKALILLPTRSEKLLTKWKGPYTVKKKIGKVNYELELPNGNCKIFNANVLKPWKEEEAYLNVIEDDQEDLPCPVQEQQKVESAGFGPGLTQNQKEQMVRLIQKYPKLIAEKPGRTDCIKHRIHTGNQAPIRQRPYRVPPALKDDVVQELTELLKMGVVEESTSEWSSPMVIVKKKDGSNRICIDYRRLNAASKFDAYPMPWIDELLNQIGKSKYLTTIDLAKGYWQVPMKKEDKEKTAFSSPLGLLLFTTIPFGLSGAPATFQRLMHKTLIGTEAYTGVYLDDIVMYGDMWKQHMENLQQAMEKLKQAGLTIKLKKCRFGADSCSYLGHKIGNGGVLLEETKGLSTLDIECAFDAHWLRPH